MLLLAGGANADTPPPTISTVAGTGTAGFGGDGGPATSALIRAPRSLSLMPDGGYLFAEPYNNAIRRVWGDGRITTVAGTGVAGFSGDGGRGHIWRN